MSEINPQIELAFDYVQHTNKNIFLTGKAGTGKTTFLHRVKKEIVKRSVVVAPTGVAAINAKGMTIHSMFQLPFGSFLPNQVNDPSRQRRFTRTKINLIKSLDLLIIDEISMVRSDLLDAIDDVLRRYKNPTQPFGGVQLLMIGDLHQLPPVVKDQEWDTLREHYQTPYFFGSLALQKTQTITIELKHIYRQSDRFFIDLLNKVRNNQLDTEVLKAINSRYIPNFKPTENDSYITLTSHNRVANEINQSRLKSINNPLYQFSAKIEKDFPRHIFPTEENLEFKVGAQVVFIKNDTSFEKRYYNGKIGKIIRISDGDIFVKCDDDESSILVSPVNWDNVKFSLDEKTKQVSEEIIGTFTQYPLKLAWAITIHKSQGLTFEKAIIDAQSAFAHGQVYVALSRCKSFEGIVLRSKIGFSSVKTDRVVRQYSDEASKNEPDEAALAKAKRDYQQVLLRELFDFQEIDRAAKGLNRVFMDNESKYATSPMPEFRKLVVQLETDIFAIGKKFQPSLHHYFHNDDLPAENETLMSRVKGAGNYFCNKFEKEIFPTLKKLPILTDNQTVKKRTEDGLERLSKMIFIKNACFKITKTGFEIQRYIQVKANADLDFATFQRELAVENMAYRVPKNAIHPKLYAQLLQWRDEEAKNEGVGAVYEILRSSSLLEIIEQLPRDTKALLNIKGIGRVKAKKYGRTIIDMIEKYCINNNIAIADAFTLDFGSGSASPKKSKRKNTKQITLGLYKEGKNIEEIARERGLTKNTIENHLAYFIGLKQVNIYQIVQRFAVDEISDFFIKNKTKASSEAKKHFDEKYSYGEIKMVLEYLKIAE